MEHARKWVMIPAESEKSEKSEKSRVSSPSQSGLSEHDLLTVIKLTKHGLISDNGTLLDSKKKPIVGLNIYQCLTQKAKAKHYHKFLEAKAKLNVRKKEKQSNKRKKTTSLEWSDDE